jgi:eukaryotic-like serine/threonine-protein kinase
MDVSARGPARIVGRYAMYDEIAAGGMATVHLGRLVGPAGFSRTVAIKKLHAQYARDPDFVAMFLDEARLAARITHPNVVPVIDVVSDGGDLFLVMEYVHGESFSFVLRILAANRKRLPPRIVGNVVAGALAGLHAAHEATSEAGQPLGIVHRDVSPQNILVGADGVPRVLDFGVAKAAGQAHTTRQGEVKGKLRYMAPEQVRCGPIDRRVDVWAASVMLWEALTGHKLFHGDNDARIIMQILEREIPSPRHLAPDVPESLARVCLRGLARDRDARFPTALEMATQIEAAVGLVSPRDVGAWVRRVAQPRLEDRARRLGEIDADAADSVAPVHASVPFGGAAKSTTDAMVSTPEIASGSRRELVTAASSIRGRSSRLRSFATAVALIGLGAVAAFGARALGDREARPSAPAAQAPAVTLSPEPIPTAVTLGEADISPLAPASASASASARRDHARRPPRSANPKSPSETF